LTKWLKKPATISDLKDIKNCQFLSEMQKISLRIVKLLFEKMSCKNYWSVKS